MKWKSLFLFLKTQFSLALSCLFIVLFKSCNWYFTVTDLSTFCTIHLRVQNKVTDEMQISRYWRFKLYKENYKDIVIDSFKTADFVKLFSYLCAEFVSDISILWIDQILKKSDIVWKSTFFFFVELQNFALL